jgi:hypothetical protein
VISVDGGGSLMEVDDEDKVKKDMMQITHNKISALF